MATEAKETELSKKERLLVQKAAIEARLRKESARERTETRARQERMQFAAGRAVLEEAADKPEFGEALRELLGRRLKEARDRTIFDLPLLDGAKSKDEKAGKKAKPTHSNGEGQPTETISAGAEPHKPKR